MLSNYYFSYENICVYISNTATTAFTEMNCLQLRMLSQYTTPIRIYTSQFCIQTTTNHSNPALNYITTTTSIITTSHFLTQPHNTILNQPTPQQGSPYRIHFLRSTSIYMHAESTLPCNHRTRSRLSPLHPTPRTTLVQRY